MFCSNCGTKLKLNSEFCDKCAYPINAIPKSDSTIDEASLITELSFSYVAMRKHFYFSLREKEGLVLFSYNYLAKGRGYIKENDVPVDPVYMQELRDFVQKNGYLHLQNATRSSHVSPKPRISDEPSCRLTMKCKRKEILSRQSRTLPPNGDKLREFFIRIAESTSDNL